MAHICNAWFHLQCFILLLRFSKSCWEAVSFEAVQLHQRGNAAGKLFMKEAGGDDPFLVEVILHPDNRLNIVKAGKMDILGSCLHWGPNRPLFVAMISFSINLITWDRTTITILEKSGSLDCSNKMEQTVVSLCCHV